MGIFSKVTPKVIRTFFTLGPAAAAAATKQNVAQQPILDIIREYFPGPESCPTGVKENPQYQGGGQWVYGKPCEDTCTYVSRALADMKLAVSDWHQPRGEKEYVDAYAMIINEYQQYYDQFCLLTIYTDVPGAGQASGGQGVLLPTLPVSDTATPVPTPGPNNKKMYWIVGGIIVLIIGGTAIYLHRKNN